MVTEHTISNGCSAPPRCLFLQFGGSSVATAERMKEVADIICSFPHQLPCVVLSAMGKVRQWGGWECQIGVNVAAFDSGKQLA